MSVDESTLVTRVLTRPQQDRSAFVERHKRATQDGSPEDCTPDRHASQTLNLVLTGWSRREFFHRRNPNSAGQQQHGRRRPSAAQATVSIQECTHSGAMERVLSDSPRTTMKNRPRPRCARTTRNGGKGTKGRYYYDDVDATTSKVDRACTRVTRTSKPLRDDGVGTKKPRWPASNHANESYQSLSSPIARDEQTTNEAHLQPTSLQPSFLYSIADSREFKSHGAPTARGW